MSSIFPSKDLFITDETEHNQKSSRLRLKYVFVIGVPL